MKRQRNSTICADDIRSLTPLRHHSSEDTNRSWNSSNSSSCVVGFGGFTGATSTSPAQVSAVPAKPGAAELQNGRA
jgi:hypothetical protein